MATFELEKSFNTGVIGIDEAGRGPWAGPVVTAAVIFRTYENLPDWVFQLNDSKKLSSVKRRALFENIRSSNTFLRYHIAVVDVRVIDSLNILEATMRGMRECIEILRTRDEMVLVDGNRKPVLQDWCYPVIKGDSISLSIAAASILAKVYRDDVMSELAKEYPQYGWEKNSGYGTAYHQYALKQHGITEHHRKSFAPIRNLSV